MKHSSALLFLFLLCSSSQTLRAQTADPWITVPLAGEGFTIQMPKNHVVKSQKNSFDQFKVDGRVYTATEDGVDYSVWSLVNEGYSSEDPPGNETYLDVCADLVWESLLKPLRDQLPKSPKPASFMSYQRALETIRLYQGREYSITLGSKTGLTHFYVAGPHIYVLTVLNPQANFAGIQRFLNSVSPKTATVRVGIGGGIGPGRGGNVSGGVGNIGGVGPSTASTASTDYNRIFSGKEVTQKARILYKAEPSYTESARNYSVQGTVVLRAVFSRSGEVTSIRAVSGLPHGLTLRAIAAARAIKFIPASNDGHAVSMYIQLEYNFNLY